MSHIQVYLGGSYEGGVDKILNFEFSHSLQYSARPSARHSFLSDVLGESLDLYSVSVAGLPLELNTWMRRKDHRQC